MISLTDALIWATAAEVGDYLIEYEDTGLTHDEDSGSRCGFDDAELAEIHRVLSGRGLTLMADDRGLVATMECEL